MIAPPQGVVMMVLILTTTATARTTATASVGGVGGGGSGLDEILDIDLERLRGGRLITVLVLTPLIIHSSIHS